MKRTLEKVRLGRVSVENHLINHSSIKRITYAQKNRSREVFGLCLLGANVGAFDDSLFSVQGTDQRESEAGSSHGHRQSGWSAASLGLNNFRTSFLKLTSISYSVSKPNWLRVYLDTLSKSFQLISGERNTRLALGNKGDDGHSGVTTDDGAVHSSWVESLNCSWKVKIWFNNETGSDWPTFSSPMKALERTISRVVTPKIRLGS